MPPSATSSADLSPPSVRSEGWRTLAKSALTSVFTSALDFATLVALVELLHVHYVVATWIGTVVGSLSNFAINKHWAFDAKDGPVARQFPRFVAVQAGASFWHAALVWALTSGLGIPYGASKLVVLCVVYLAWNYPLNRWFVFAHARPRG